MKKITITIISSLFLTACASTNMQEESEYERIILRERQELKHNIKEVAEKAYEVQRVVSQVRNAQALRSEHLTPEVMRYTEHQASYIPVGMEREMSVTWPAYPEQILGLLANASGYQIEFVGQPYPIKRVVNIDPRPRNIKRLIDDVESQSVNYIKNVEIFEDSKLIVVNYEQGG